MKEEILKRAMFAMPLSKEAQGTGIMSGFDMEEMDSMDEDVDENADMEEMPPMARTPQNPEILMNTLRGDMRSLDARYMELAQMVGEEAAMETPPEVLAMLMGQMGAQQSGIGSLPQGQDMMPTAPGMMPTAPGMMPPGAAGMPPPDQMGAPQPAPAMPQGGIPMPSGMESAPPFSPGAEAPQQFNKGGVARRRGDDAQLLEGGGGGGGGGFTSPTFSAPPVRPPAFEVTPTGQAALARPPSMFNRDYLGGLNQYLGGKMMAPQPSVSRLTGGSPPINLTRQQQEALVQNPATGVISQGTGTRLAPYTTMAPLTSPTFTQGFTQGLNRVAAEYPRVAALLPPSILAAVGIVGPTLTEDQRSTPLTAPEQAKYDETMRQIDAVNRPARLGGMENAKKGMLGENIPTAFPPAPVMKQEEAAPSDDPLGAFITEKLAAFDKREEAQSKTLAKDLKAAVEGKSKMQRIRESQAEYAPLFEELLGSDKESAKINALLLLSEAGLKLASTSKPTFAMALADASSGLPRGFAAIAAQERELGMKVKGASLQQAISDVDGQDKYAQALKLQLLKGDFELLKEQTKQSGGIIKDGGMGLRITETKNGSFVGSGIDPNDPEVTSALSSSFTLRDTDNPFVENRGRAPTTIVRDKAQRLKLGETLTSLENSLKTLDNLKGVYVSAYGPGAWFSDKVNNLLVPIDPTGLVKPNFNTADAATRISTGMNSLLKSIASANDGGRVAVQEQEWVRETAKGISNPTAFFADKELAAQQFGSTEATLRNARQQVLTQLGFEGNDYVMRTPNTGTKNDPFIIPSDPAQQKPMFTFLGSTIGNVQDPRAMVHLRMPNGTVQQFSPTQLRALNQ